MLANGNPVLSESELSWLAFELGLAVLLYLAFKVALVRQLFGEGESDEDPDWAGNARLCVQ
jgi:hypothetical protein